MTSKPFWPRRSPHFAKLRAAVRPYVAAPTVVGLSGGADSLALYAAALAESPSVTAVIIDHGLQPGSAGVAARAAAQVHQLGGRAQVIAVDVDDAAGEGMEAAARKARYQALAGAAAGRPVLVAHTADDQAETLLLGLLRGRVTGMADRSDIEGAHVVRPLLGLRRADTAAACAELGLDYWSDPHNDDRAFRRVAVRKDVLPALATAAGADIVPALAQAASDAACDDAYLTPADLTDDCNALAALPEPVRRRAIAGWLRANNLAVTRPAIAGIDALCCAWSGQGGVAVAPAGTKTGGGRLEVCRTGGRLALMHNS